MESNLICSYNVRGLADIKKDNKFFNGCEIKSFQFAFFWKHIYLQLDKLGKPYMRRMIYYKVLLLCGSVLFIIRDAKATSSIILQPSMVYLFEGKSVNLTCAFTKSANYTLIWTNPAFGFIDYRNQTHACNISGSLFQSGAYSVYCNDTAVNVTVNFVEKIRSQYWTCQNLSSPYIAVSAVYFGVLVSNVSISANTSLGELDADKLTLNETNIVTFVCQSSYCRPNAMASLRFSKSSQQYKLFSTPTKQSYNNISDLWQHSYFFEVSLNRSMNDWNVSCIATNDRETYVTSRNIYLNIQYPPTEPPSIHGLQNGSVYKVVKNREGQLVCSSDKGNPPAELTWSFENKTTNFTEIFNSTSTTVRWTASRNNNPKVTCTSNHILSEPRNISVNVEVLYPPEEIAITSTTSPNIFVSDGISIIENTFLKLICTAKGNPLPSVYSWTGLYSSETSEVNIYSSRKRQGNLTCIATNFMTDLTENKTVVGMNSKTIYLDVLYPPAILHLAETEVVKGQDVNISCIVTPGKTSTHSAQWMRELEYITLSNSLTIRNVTRKDAGYYMCSVNYTMVPTYGEPKTGLITQNIYLDVLYKPEISTFFVERSENNVSVTINESSQMRMVCAVDSNPSSTMSISVRNHTIAFKESTYSLEYFVNKSDCTDTGIYECAGQNFLNEQKASSSRQLRLFVNCSPRPSHRTETRQNISVPLLGSATFSFVAVAYPTPDLIWIHIVNSTQSEANNGYIKTFKISESEIKIDFTLINVALSDYGEYVLTINNTFGGYQQSFFLTKKDQSNEDEDPSDKGIAGLISGVAVGSAVGTSLIVTIVYIIRRRLHKHRDDPNKFSELKDINTYQNFPQDDIYKANNYERLQNSEQSNAYETLQSTCNTVSPQVGKSSEEIETTFENSDKQNAD